MGPLPQDNTWTDTGEEFFLRGMKRVLFLEEAAQGPSTELNALVPLLFEKAIPRTFEAPRDRRKLNQTCTHTCDLWYGNCCMDSNTDRPIVFDACSFWAHNECKSSEPFPN